MRMIKAHKQFNYNSLQNTTTLPGDMKTATETNLTNAYVTLETKLQFPMDMLLLFCTLTKKISSEVARSRIAM